MRNIILLCLFCTSISYGCSTGPWRNVPETIRIENSWIDEDKVIQETLQYNGCSELKGKTVSLTIKSEIKPEDKIIETYFSKFPAQKGSIFYTSLSDGIDNIVKKRLQNRLIEYCGVQIIDSKNKVDFNINININRFYVQITEGNNTFKRLSPATFQLTGFNESSLTVGGVALIDISSTINGKTYVFKNTINYDSKSEGKFDNDLIGKTVRRSYFNNKLLSLFAFAYRQTRSGLNNNWDPMEANVRLIIYNSDGIKKKELEMDMQRLPYYWKAVNLSNSNLEMMKEFVERSENSNMKDYIMYDHLYNGPMTDVGHGLVYGYGQIIYLTHDYINNLIKNLIGE